MPKPLLLVLFAILSTLPSAFAAVSTSQASALGATDSSGFFLATNGVGVYRKWVTYSTNVSPNPRFGQTNRLASATNRYPPEVLDKLMKRWANEPQYLTNGYPNTNSVFDHFAPESLSYKLLTNMVARTNGRTSLMWSKNSHPLLWPSSPPQVNWNHDSLIWDMKGVTALSPCWQQEGAPGQVPITLLTRRHGYTRGHGMGPPGFRDAFNGKRVWFVTRDDKVVEARVAGAIVRYQPGRDYSILMFKEDLPGSIEPMRVVSEESMRIHYPWPDKTTPIFVRTEQGGHACVDLPGFSTALYKGGDSGSPNLLPYFDELIFAGGRTTSPPSATMQEDINELCTRLKVDPVKYQLQWVDLGKFPSY